MKILLLSVTFPYPPTKGGTQVRTYNLLKYLQARHEVTVVTQVGADTLEAEIAILREQVSELVTFPRPQELKSDGILGKVGRSLQAWYRGIPTSVLFNQSPEMQAWVDANLRRFAVVTCEHSVNEVFLPAPCPIPAVVNVHSSVYGSCRQQLLTGTASYPLRDWLNLPLLYLYERRYCQKFTAIVVTTEDDRAYLQKFLPNSASTEPSRNAPDCLDRLVVIPNGVDLTKFPYRSLDPGGMKLVFTGAMDSLPNIDAAQFLSQTILPAVRQIYPETTLELVGDRPTPAVQELGKLPGVIVTGKVDSMVERLHQATIAVLPLRTGLGIKNKTLEALAAGIPVVGSNQALEGLRVDGNDVPLRALRANSPSEYVAAISQLFADPSLRRELSKNGRSLMETQFTWDIAGASYERVLSQTR
ncbi:MAG: glycosyltransferase [Coleofasciculaceae cyanobacterium SM2_1_6]|nr:glycosyltransferase [Coleofasciculaceae cyanobacterium SM2_1_6]